MATLIDRREWASGKFGLIAIQAPDDFTPHGWGPAYVPESNDTLEEVLAHISMLVEEGILMPEERARSEAFYKSLFHVNTSQHEPYNGETPIGIMLDGGYSDVD